MISRRPGALLRPFVSMLWASDGGLASEASRELVLPTGMNHLVFRLDASPLRLFDHVGAREGANVSTAVVGGARVESYCKELSSPVASVGIQFEPGGAACLLGVPADELAGRHTALADLWGLEAERWRERLAAVPELHRRLDLMERLLVDRIQRRFAPSAGVLAALSELTRGVPVSAVVGASGYSHRQFNVRFAQAVGLTPKAYQRVRRFQALLEALRAAPAQDAAQLALEAGYADQAHLSREFKAMAGLTLGQYRAIAPRSPNHVPVQVKFVQDAGPPGAHHEDAETQS